VSEYYRRRRLRYSKEFHIRRFPADKPELHQNVLNLGEGRIAVLWPVADKWGYTEPRRVVAA
jgi:hypothetical protein